jgi:hypothetical protein
MTSPLEGSRWSGRLHTQDADDPLDLADSVGQRSASFRFFAFNIGTGYRQQVYPLRNSAPTLNHDSSRTIPRTIDNILFGEEDTAILDAIKTRLEIYMLTGGTLTSPAAIDPLGRYMYGNEARTRYTAGDLSAGSFYDESFIVDQKLDTSFGNGEAVSSGLPATPAQTAIAAFLARKPITYKIEYSPYGTIGAWPAGTGGGQVTQALALDGDYFPPWFDNTGVMRWIRAFDPATATPTFDFDGANKVLREPPPRFTNDLINAPNRVIVVSNGTLTTDQAGSPIVGSYDVPSSAPHSIVNRGYVVPYTEYRQIQSDPQAQAMAVNIGMRQTIYEQCVLFTAPDPRHDGYDVIRWRGSNWLELAWSLPLVDGSRMQHTLRKAYLS